MKLLHWCTLHPEGEAGLAAIRFAAPIRVSSIRVYPKGAQPFTQCPDVVAQTEPESFFLDVYFNAHPVLQQLPESKEKQRAPNALVPTSIAYAGGQLDFTVDLGTEYATRLMIVKGQYDALSLAIYGEVVSETPLVSEPSIPPMAVPLLEPQTLPNSIDPANAADPTFLARNLLSLIDDSPPLALITRLMFCLKPDNDDWDDPEFPYLHADLDDILADTDSDSEFSIERALDSMSKPVSDTVPEDILTRFAEVVAGSIGPKTNGQAFHIAKVFKISASQRPSLSLALCQLIDPSDVYDEQVLDEDTLLLLYDACANADIARYFHNDAFLATLAAFSDPLLSSSTTQASINSNSNSDYTHNNTNNHNVNSSPPNLNLATQTRSARDAAEKLVARLHASEIFEDALSNAEAHFGEAALMLRDIGSNEQSLGIWLASMIAHEDLVRALKENPVSVGGNLRKVNLFGKDTDVNTDAGVNAGLGMRINGSLSSSSSLVAHDDFVAFVRAFIGVASVLTVWAWSDSLGNDVCRERALGVLRLWQGTDGYREIVNYLLLLRQFTRRLEWITTNNDTPRKSGVFGEQILSELVKEPEAVLRDDLVQTILSLKPPLSYISESERLFMRKVALVVEDGLPAAIEELSFPTSHPLSIRRLRILRVAIALVDRELNEDTERGEWSVLQTIWNDHSTALIPRLVELLVGVANDLNEHFVITSASHIPTPSSFVPKLMNAPLLEQLFRLAEDLLGLLLQLVPRLFTLTTYALRTLIHSLADVFACTDAAADEQKNSQPVCLAAHSTRQWCLVFVRKMSDLTSKPSSGPGPGAGVVVVEPGKLGAEVVLRVLLGIGVRSKGRDPAHHLVQIQRLIDCVLPGPASTSNFEDHEQRDAEDVATRWALEVLPNVSYEMRAFFRLLDVDNKMHLLRKLVKLDKDGMIGLSEWLLVEELKLFQRGVKVLVDESGSAGLGVVAGAQAENSQVVVLYQIGLHLRLVERMIHPSSDMSAWCVGVLKSLSEASEAMTVALIDLLSIRVESPHLYAVVGTLLQHHHELDTNLRFALVLSSLREAQRSPEEWNSWATVLDILKPIPPECISPDPLKLELGQAFAAIAKSGTTLPTATSSAIISFMEWLESQSEQKLTILCGIKADELTTLYDMLSATLSKAEVDRLDTVRSTLTTDEDDPFVAPDLKIPDTLQLSLQSLEDMFLPWEAPSTPTRTNVPDVLGLVISPPAALLRSPAATGLTKTYSNNDFRQLRQAAVARQNTSRLPSMHVDVGIDGQLT